MKRLLLFFLLLLTLPVFADSKIQWYRSFDRALADAKKNSKPLFVDVYTDWCTWCHMLDHDVYSTPQFAKYMQNYIPVKLDAEDGKEGTRFAEKYRVDGFPTLIVTDSAGILTNRIGGYMDANALIKDMDRIQQLIAREQSHPEEIQTTFQLAHEYLMRDMYSEAEARFRKVVASPKARMDLKDESEFSIALSQYYQGKLQPALDSLQTYQADFSHGKSEEDALLLLSQLQIETDANDQARDTLKEFLRRYPHSDSVDRAREVLDSLGNISPQSHEDH